MTAAASVGRRAAAAARGLTERESIRSRAGGGPRLPAALRPRGRALVVPWAARGAVGAAPPRGASGAPAAARRRLRHRPQPGGVRAARHRARRRSVATGDRLLPPPRAGRRGGGGDRGPAV